MRGCGGGLNTRGCAVRGALASFVQVGHRKGAPACAPCTLREVRCDVVIPLGTMCPTAH